MQEEGGRRRSSGHNVDQRLGCGGELFRRSKTLS